MDRINFNELTMDNIYQCPFLVKFFIVILLKVLLTSLGCFIIIKPDFEQYKLLVNQENNLKIAFELKQQQAATLQIYQNQMKQLKDQWGNLLKLLPRRDETADLVKIISEIGIRNGLVIELFSLMPEVACDFYIELPITITVMGGYHQLALFLSQIAAMERMVTFHDFEIIRDSVDKQTDNSGDLLIMRMTLKIYQYRSQ